MKRYNWGFYQYDVPDDWVPHYGGGKRYHTDFGDEWAGVIPGVIGWMMPDGQFMSPDKCPEYRVPVPENPKDLILQEIAAEIKEMEAENPHVFDNDRDPQRVSLERELAEYKNYAENLSQLLEEQKAKTAKAEAESRKWVKVLYATFMTANVAAKEATEENYRGGFLAIASCVGGAIKSGLKE